MVGFAEAERVARGDRVMVEHHRLSPGVLAITMRKGTVIRTDSEHPPRFIGDAPDGEWVEVRFDDTGEVDSFWPYLVRPLDAIERLAELADA